MGVILDTLDAQKGLQPGQEGWWKVWGASVRDIRAGDMYMAKSADGGYTEERVAELLPYADDDMRRHIRLRYRNDAGEVLTIGMLCPVQVIRYGTHNTLAGSVR